MSSPNPIKLRTLYRVNVDSLRSAICSDEQPLLVYKRVKEGLSFVDESAYTTCADSKAKALSQVFFKAGVPWDYIGDLVEAGKRFSKSCMTVLVRNIYPKSSVMINRVTEYYVMHGYRIASGGSAAVTHDREIIISELGKMFRGRRRNLVMTYERIEREISKKSGQNAASQELAGEAGPVKKPVLVKRYAEAMLF
jgi:hypothetical protein